VIQKGRKNPKLYLVTDTHVDVLKPNQLETAHGHATKLGDIGRVNGDKTWRRIDKMPTHLKITKVKIAPPGTIHVIAQHHSEKKDEWVTSTGTYNPTIGGNYPSEDGSSGMGIFDRADGHCIGLHFGDRGSSRKINVWDADDLLWMSSD